MFTAGLFTPTWKQPKCPLTDEQIKKIYMHIYIMEYYSVIKIMK